MLTTSSNPHPHRLRKRIPSARRNAAFSLVEVVLAVGILAVAVIPILALAALSSNSDRDSQDIATSALIASDLIGVFQQADWQTISHWDSAGGPEVYYDIEGQVIAGTDVATPQEELRAAFTAKLHFPSGSPLNGSTLQALVLVSSKPGNLGATEIADEIAALGSNSSVRRYPAIAVQLEKE